MTLVPEQRAQSFVVDVSKNGELFTDNLSLAKRCQVCKAPLVRECYDGGRRFSSCCYACWKLPSTGKDWHNDRDENDLDEYMINLFRNYMASISSDDDSD